MGGGISTFQIPGIAVFISECLSHVKCLRTLAKCYQQFYLLKILLLEKKNGARYESDALITGLSDSGKDLPLPAHPKLAS
jgi:hypothetical protein